MPKRITPDQQRDVVALRLTRQLSTPAIAKRVGISNYSVYKILRGYPWRPTERRGATHGFDWTPAQDVLLKRLWPTAERAEIEALLAPHSWQAISKRAPTIGAERRMMPGGRRRITKTMPFFKELFTARRKLKMSRPQLSALCGHHINQLVNWELGKCVPNFAATCDWANALGFDVVLKPRGAAAFAEAEVPRDKQPQYAAIGRWIFPPHPFLDAERREFILNGRRAHAEPGEWRLFEVLAKNGGAFVEKERIYDLLYPPGAFDDPPDPKIIDVMLSKLRKKLPFAVEVVRGAGWMLVGYKMEREMVETYPIEGVDRKRMMAGR